MTNPTTKSVTAALALGATLTLVSLPLLAQSQQSATDESGTPVGVAEEGAAGGPEIVGTDGLIRYGSAEEMWQTISSKWDTLGEQASERWTEIDKEKLMETGGDREGLVSLVSESYDMSEEQAREEVTAWAASAEDDAS